MVALDHVGCIDDYAHSRRVFEECRELRPFVHLEFTISGYLLPQVASKPLRAIRPTALMAARENILDVLIRYVFDRIPYLVHRTSF